MALFTVQTFAVKSGEEFHLGEEERVIGADYPGDGNPYVYLIVLRPV